MPTAKLPSPSGYLTRLLGVCGLIRAEERRDVAGAFLTLLGFMTGHAMLETARDALFLAELSPSLLPWVYLTLAASALLLTRYHPNLARHLPQGQELTGWLLFAAITSSALWFAIIGSGSILGAILGSGFASAMSAILPAQNLVLIAAGIFFLASLGPRLMSAAADKDANRALAAGLSAAGGLSEAGRRLRPRVYECRGTDQTACALTGLRQRS